MSSSPQDQRNTERNLYNELQYFLRLFDEQKYRKQDNRQIQNNNINLQHYKLTIGVIHAVWTSKNGKVLATNIGTAFAVSNDLIITCTHNIYTNRIKSYAKTIEFLPGYSIQQDEKPSDFNIIKAQLSQKFLVKDISSLNFEIEPIIEELTLLKLQRSIQLSGESFPALGNLERLAFDASVDELAVVGYPNMYFTSRKFKENQNFKLVQVRGPLDFKQEHSIHYQIDTSVGMSGSPIFAIKNNQIIVVGIHTHRGKSVTGQPHQKPNYNSGLYFNQDILKTIQLYQEQVYYINSDQSVSIKTKIKNKRHRLKLYDKKIEEKQVSYEIQKYILESQQKDDEPIEMSHVDQSYQNISLLSVSEDTSFQNTSQISKTEYEWLTTLPLLNQFLKKTSSSSPSSSSSQQQQKFELQCHQSTDSTDTSFLYQD